MTKILTRTYTDLRLHISYALLGACLFTIFIYGINIYRVIAHTVMVQETERTMATLGSNVQELDSQYLQLSGNLTPDRIQTLGLQEGHVSQYISRSIQRSHVTLSLHEL